MRQKSPSKINANDARNNIFYTTIAVGEIDIKKKAAMRLLFFMGGVYRR